MSTSPPIVNWQPSQPFSTLPLLPPLVEIDSKAVLRQCITARSALAGLNQAAALIPNPAVLINTLPLLEAQASSEIENIVTTTDQLFRHLRDDQAADPATKEALRYSTALLQGYHSLTQHPLTTRTAETICTQIKGVQMNIRKVPGTVLSNAITGETIYTPPVGEDTLRNLLSNWERFMHNETAYDPLIKMAVGHYQFEAIHPFTDGNGRTGRIINSLYLIEAKLLALPILYLSRYIMRNKAEYYRLLLKVTQDGDWESWIIYILKGIEDTAVWTTNKIAAIRDLQEHTTKHVSERAPKIYTHELVNLIFGLPYCRIVNLTEAGIAKRQTASIYIRRLIEIGVLAEAPSTKENLYLHPKLMKLLTHEDNKFELYI